MVGLAEVEAALPMFLLIDLQVIAFFFARRRAFKRRACVSGVSNDWRASSRCVRAEGRVYEEVDVEVDYPSLTR